MVVITERHGRQIFCDYCKKQIKGEQDSDDNVTIFHKGSHFHPGDCYLFGKEGSTQRAFGFDHLNDTNS